MIRKARSRKVAKKASRILYRNIASPLIFYSRKEILMVFALAVLFLAAVNAKIIMSDLRFPDPSAAGAQAESGEMALNAGKTEGTGTHFSITDSSYLNIGLDSVDPVILSLESVPEMIIMKTEPGTEVFSTNITLSGLLPNTTYHKYEDTYKNHQEIVSDSEGKYTYVQDLSSLHFIFIQPRPSTTFISNTVGGGNCSSVGIWDASTRTCTLTQDITGTVEIDSDGVNSITLDGNGKTISGNGTGSGIFIPTYVPGYTPRYITIKNANIRGFSMGIYTSSIKDSIITNNNLTNNGDGFYLQVASYSSITNNTVKNSIRSGVKVTHNNNNTFAGNTLSNNAYGIRIEELSNDNIVKDNIITSNIYWGIIPWLSSGNTIYNNYFSNAINYLSDRQGYNNYWNIAKTPGKNIVGGQNIGGNFWGNPSQNDFSETCIDADGDSICDAAYNLYYDNIDSLPLGRADTIPPTTTIGISGTAGVAPWYISDINVTLSANDNSGASSVAKTEYSFDNASWTIYTSAFSVGTEGESVIYYRSIDNAGNVESTASKSVMIDKSAPVTSGATTVPPNSNGWYNSAVVVRFNCNDAVSGPVESFFDAPPVDSDGANQSVAGKCTDKAGNNSSDFIVDGINIDRVAPIISTARVPEANSRGWNNTSVEVTFTATDALSGIDGESSDTVLFDEEGSGQSSSRIFKDKAGNISSASISKINIDLTAPLISGSALTVPNSNGWYSSDVIVRFTASDTLSGIAGLPPDVTLRTEGKNQDAMGLAEDSAGNRSSAKVGGINIDKTPPVITGAPLSSPNSNNWYNSDVEVSFVATDDISGIDTVTPKTVISHEGSDQSVIGFAADKAGNRAEATVGGINIDTTPPTISGTATTSPNSNGWYNTDVVIHYNASDSLSGVDTVSPDSKIDTEGGSQSATGFALDRAGNRAVSSVDGINIDKTAPMTRLSLASEAGSSCYGDNIIMSLSGTDAVSGIAGIFYNLNGAGWSNYTDRVSFFNEGLYNLLYRSIDKADNSENEKAASFTIDKTAPEAIIKFDPAAKDITVLSSETGNGVKYTIVPSKDTPDKEDGDKGWKLRKYIIKDCGSNSLILLLRHKKSGNEVKARIVSMQYDNAQAITPRNNKISIEYSQEKNGVIKELEQDIKADRVFEVDAKYGASKNQTEIKVKLEGRKEKKETKPGMVMLQLLTNNGSLEYLY